MPERLRNKSVVDDGAPAAAAAAGCKLGSVGVGVEGVAPSARPDGSAGDAEVDRERAALGLLLLLLELLLAMARNGRGDACGDDTLLWELVVGSTPARHVNVPSRAPSSGASA